MPTTIFNGQTFALNREAQLKQRIDTLKEQGKQLKIAAILFTEDAGSQLYTAKKSEAAARVGIDYEVHSFSILDSIDLILQKLQELNRDEQVTGIIIQKPWGKTWRQAHEVEQQSAAQSREAALKNTDQTRGEPKNFQEWWTVLVSAIDEKKDVDGLHPNTHQAIKEGTWQEQGGVLPATCKAVLEILKEAEKVFAGSEPQIKQKFIIIGRSDLLGRPLYHELLNHQKNAELIGRKEFEERVAQEKYLLDADVVVTATGIKHLVKADMLKQSAVVIDAGEPNPDVDFNAAQDKTSFITPVPGGVGPVTVVCLLENCVDLVS